MKIKSKKIKLKNEDNNIKTTKFTNFVINLKGFFLKKKKIIKKRKNDNDINESNFFNTMKNMMILSFKREHIIKFFKKDKTLRAEIETQSVADYLSTNKKNIFFNTIRKINKSKLYTLVHNLTLEYYKKDDLIFLYKEPLNKFYIILEGTISLYLPYFIKRQITIKEFLNYFFYTKQNFPKSFIRVEKKNEYLFDGIYQLKINEYNMNYLSEFDVDKKQDFYIEEYQNVYNIYEGNQVNQISLLYNLVQNFNGYAKTDVYILSLNKSDFIHILRACLEEELSKEFGQLRKYCYIFNLWNNYSLAQIMNYCIPFNHINEEIIYNQKDESDSFYIIEDGIFEVFCEISLSEFSQYRKYVLRNNQNIIEWIKEQKEKKNKISVEKIIDYIQWKINEEKYPEGKEIIDKNIIYIKKNLLNKGEENDEKLINLKVNEEILKEKNKKIKIKLFTLQKNDFIGLEDSLELKSRFYNVKCVTDKGILNKIRILDFIVFIASNHGLDLNNIFYYVKERKNNIIERVINNLNRELNNSQRTIDHAYTLALTSFEKRKNLKLKIKTDNIYNIHYTSNLNLNENLLQKIQGLKQKNKTMNTLEEYKDKNINYKRKKSAGIRRTLFLNQLINNKDNNKKYLVRNLKWNFNNNNKLIEKNRKMNKISILSTSNTDRKIQKTKNKANKYEINIDNIDNNNDNIDYNDNNYNISYWKNKNITKSKYLRKKFLDFNFTINTLYNKKYDFLKNKDLSFFNKKLDKEIKNMTGIYNTKRELSKKQISIPSSNDTKTSKRILSSYKFMHSNYINQNKNDILNSELLSITNISIGIKTKQKRYKSIIPFMKNEKIRNYINK